MIALADIPATQLACLYGDADTALPRVLCDWCAPALLGPDFADDVLSSPGQICVRCGSYRLSPVDEALHAATDAVIQAVLLGATSDQLLEVLTEARAEIVRQQWKSGASERPPNQRTLAPNLDPACIGCLATLVEGVHS